MICEFIETTDNYGNPNQFCFQLFEIIFSEKAWINGNVYVESIVRHSLVAFIIHSETRRTQLGVRSPNQREFIIS